MNNDCIFCKIIEGAIPSYKVYEDDSVLAFLTISPHSKGHTLVVPKKHSETIYDISEEDLYKTISITKKVAKQLKTILKADGITIGQNNETAGGQEIFHTHFHVIPRFMNDGYKSWSTEKVDSQQLLYISKQVAIK